MWTFTFPITLKCFYNFAVAVLANAKNNLQFSLIRVLFCEQIHALAILLHACKKTLKAVAALPFERKWYYSSESENVGKIAIAERDLRFYGYACCRRAL